MFASLDKFREEREEAERRVEIIRLSRRTFRYSNSGSEYLRDKSFNKFTIDGVERGFLAMETGWRKDWHIENLDERRVDTYVFANNRNDAKRYILRSFKKGELPTREEIDAEKARLKKNLERAKQKDLKRRETRR